MAHLAELAADTNTSYPSDADETEGEIAQRKPRIAIMGEFSAGKSTLTNLLMGAQALPVRITATQLPPVWLTHGAGPAEGVAVEGTRFPVDLDDPSSIPLHLTRHIRVQRLAPVLELCDLLDFPGISDPNMPTEVWERVAPLADGVLWLTHATQAWRQSEAAFWEAMPETLRSNSLLLLTRFDKITSERDQRRVVARVRRETEGLFSRVLPVSLTRASAAGDDRAAFIASGAEAMMDALLETVTTLSRELGGDIPMLSGDAATQDQVVAEAEAIAPVEAAPEEEPLAPTTLPSADSAPAVNAPEVAGRIVPRRVRRVAGAARVARPPADAARPSPFD